MTELIRPSSLPRLALCPGSKDASKHIPDPGSEYAQRGTDLHAAIQGALKLPDNLETLEKLYEWCDDVNDYMMAVQIVRTIRREFLYEDKPNDVEWIECEIETPDMPEIGVKGGHADIAIAYGDMLHIIDIKTGRNEVPPPEKNLQLLAYGIALREKYDKLFTYLHIIDYNANVISYMLEPQLIDMFKDVIGAVVVNAESADAERNPDPDACRYCTAFGTKYCPETKEIMKGLEDMDDNHEELAEAMKFASCAKNAGERAKRIFRDAHEAGEELPDTITVRKGRTNRFISDTNKAVEALISYGFDPEQVTECMSLHTTKAAGILMRDFGIESEREAKEIIQSKLEEYECLEQSTGYAPVTYKPKKEGDA